MNIISLFDNFVKFVNNVNWQSVYKTENQVTYKCVHLKQSYKTRKFKEDMYLHYPNNVLNVYLFIFIFLGAATVWNWWNFRFCIKQNREFNFGRAVLGNISQPCVSFYIHLFISKIKATATTKATGFSRDIFRNL